jgi:hypothetical protein
VNGANTYFQPSGIQFLFNPATDIEIRHDTRLNQETQADHQHRMQLGADYHGYLVVIFRRRAGLVGGCRYTTSARCVATPVQVTFGKPMLGPLRRRHQPLRVHVTRKMQVTDITTGE